MLTGCLACHCIRACSPRLSREDAVAFGAICGLIEATENGAQLSGLCADHEHKLGLLRSVGTFDRDDTRENQRRVSK